MDNFAQCWDFTIGIEKGFQKNPSDPGNWTGGKVGIGILKGTKYGISAASYPDENIENLTPDRAQFIARRDFYDAHQCGQLPPIMALMVFDTSFNGGFAIRWLQECVGATPDGINGAKTIACARAANTWRTVALFAAKRLRYMQSLKNFKDNAGGWILRVASMIEQGDK